MKILLVFPTITIYDGDPSIPGPSPPLGLGYIASVLERAGYNVKILDALAMGINKIGRENGKTRYGLTDEEILTNISHFNPDIVGITSMFSAYASDGHSIAKLVKNYNPKILVVMGGAHCSIKPEWTLKDKNVDIVVIGEGEYTFLELVTTFVEKKDISKISGTAVRIDNRVFINKSRPYIENLDEVPFPARHLMPMSVYLKNSKSKSEYVMRYPSTTLVTSRGCPGICVYCSIHSLWGHKWRERSPKNVIDEVEFLVKRYGVREIHFLDDNIAASKKRLDEICDEIIKRKLDIKWTAPNGIAHWMLNEKLLNKMKRSGCYRLTFGIESGNLDTRKFIGKKYSLEQAKKIIKYANKIGIWTLCTFIIGFPYEQEDSIKDTIKFSCDSETDFALFFLLNPFPGTPVYQIFKDEGWVDLERIFESYDAKIEDFSWLGKSLANYGIQTKFYAPKELQNHMVTAYRTFMRNRLKNYLLNPIKILRKIKSLEDLQYTIKICVHMAKPIYFMLKNKFLHYKLQKTI